MTTFDAAESGTRESGGASGPPPQAPVRGRSRRLLGRFHITGAFWYRFHGIGIRFIPVWLVPILMPFFTVFFFLVLRRIGRALASNLDAVLGPATGWRRQRRSYRSIREFAWCLTERYERMSAGRPTEAVVEGHEHWREMLSRPEGFVLITAHIGHWELGPESATHEGRRHVHVVREAEMDPEAQEFLSELLRRQAGESFTFHFAGGDSSLGVELLSALRRGELVALQGDRPRSSGRSVPVRLFDRPFEIPVGPLALARAAGVSLLPVFCFRDGRLRSLQACRPPVEVARTSDRDADFRAAAGRLAVEIEWAIRREPHQWFCLRELWPS